MSRAEMKKVIVVQKITDGHMTNGEGAEALGLTTRQIIRLKQRYQEGGAEALVHKNRGRKPVHAIGEEMKERVAALYAQTYHGSNSCHFSELLEEHETITLSAPSVRRILLAKGLKQSKQRRRSKAHQPRTRRSKAGMLWQIDATPYAWLEDRAPAFALHGAIDDATGIVVGAMFTEQECREGYSLVMQQGIHAYGIPLALYSDRHTIFRSVNEKLSIEQELAGETRPLSNFGKAMQELGVEHIKARTPQAKGRVERLWGTFQDRLVIELRLLSVNTIEEANKALPKLVAKHNQLFAVSPKETESAYVELAPDINLDHVFSERSYRKIGAGNTLSYGSKIYTLASPSACRLDARMTVEIRETLKGDVVLWRDGKAFPLKETQKPTRVQKSKQADPTPPRKPADDHPWKKGRVVLPRKKA